MNFDQFFQAYVDCALWASDDEDGQMSDLYSIDDIDQTTLAAMQEDCQDFVDQAGELLDGLDAVQCEQDLWLTRCGHGAGFWDRGLGDVGERLSELARCMGDSYLYVGDDGVIYGH